MWLSNCVTKFAYSVDRGTNLAFYFSHLSYEADCVLCVDFYFENGILNIFYHSDFHSWLFFPSFNDEKAFMWHQDIKLAMLASNWGVFSVIFLITKSKLLDAKYKHLDRSYHLRAEIRGYRACRPERWSTTTTEQN